MGKQFSLSFDVKDDNTIETESIKVKLESPKKKPPKAPPGEDFVRILLFIFLGVWLIVTFLVPGGKKSINQQPSTPASTASPSNSQNNPTTTSSSNYDPLEIISFEED
ncbi:MAG: hypothetical protein F6K25_28430 [Okeania sp. SIO2G4]|uniref:hypothetical protein n=1 Tax=unclassified Okeania TaxID=2634635 RepID=UPI0013BD32B6|nr:MULTISPECIES: hypothetical protein [unclassified Okeania]NEP43718.1 hypothetical protein [Okeania sp. SIO2H7]NEP75519.1 hypothetical protein [Okeania sp. SIO2G5]NEP96640.1 hypothetical protein [Okeania sp. SIO2F5]NEQ94366.1 hypothetical protein [Okeania sp. SIO2G4]